jgi:hypothetical protein
MATTVTYDLSKNYDHIKTEKNDEGEYECAICEQPFESPEQVCWAGVEDFDAEGGKPLCLYCCKQLVKEHEGDSSDDEDEDASD